MFVEQGQPLRSMNVYGREQGRGCVVAGGTVTAVIVQDSEERPGVLTPDCAPIVCPHHDIGYLDASARRRGGTPQLCCRFVYSS